MLRKKGLYFFHLFIVAKIGVYQRIVSLKIGCKPSRLPKK